MTVEISVLVTSLLLSAFFSGMEIAFVSSNKIRLEIQKTQQKSFGTLLKIITKSPSRFIVSMLVGNNIALVVYGIYAGELIVFEMFPDYVNYNSLPLNIIFYQTLISTAIILITAEFLPKVFFQIYANRFLSLFALPAYIFYQLMKPLSWVVMRFSDVTLHRFFRLQKQEAPIAFSKVELGDFVSEQIEIANDENQDPELQLFHNALSFTNLKAREVMVPRAEMIAVDRYEKPKDLLDIFSSTGFSKILIYAQSMDNIVGYVHAFDMFKKPKSLHTIIKAVEWIPETMRIQDVFNHLVKKRRSIAVVLDEYGGTAGMLTLEDIIEELFGEIEDEHDNVNSVSITHDDGSFTFSARLEINEINTEYDIDLPVSESYETLGGLIVHNTADIPIEGERVFIEGYTFEMLEVSNTKIDLVRIYQE
jgi:CBS domain containing-hemolysin-like protein